MTEKPIEQIATARPAESLTCDKCGQDSAVEMGDRQICPDCYSQTCASCCPEFGCEE